MNKKRLFHDQLKGFSHDEDAEDPKKNYVPYVFEPDPKPHSRRNPRFQRPITARIKVETKTCPENHHEQMPSPTKRFAYQLDC